MIVHTHSFMPTETPSEYAIKYGWKEGTVEVTFEGKTRRVDCIAPNENRNDWVIYHLCARYATGVKVWPATIWFNPEAKTFRVSTGFENRSGRFTKPRLVGFLADVKTHNVSKR